MTVQLGEDDLVVAFVEDADALVSGGEPAAEEGQHEVIPGWTAVVQRADVIAWTHLDSGALPRGVGHDRPRLCAERTGGGDGVPAPSFHPGGVKSAALPVLR